jgi:predicted RNase H-related nuclease YkuK (DUF458 family)
MDPYAEQDQPARPRRGCLWGCLAALVAAVVIVVAVFGYGAWYFYKGFSNDQRIQTIVDALNQSDEAGAVLGRGIKAMQVHIHTFDYSTGKGGTATYVIKVIGSNGEGEVKADLDIGGDKAEIKSLVLTDAAGSPHYIVGEPPPNPMMQQNSI